MIFKLIIGLLIERIILNQEKDLISIHFIASQVKAVFAVLIEIINRFIQIGMKTLVASPLLSALSFDSSHSNPLSKGFLEDEEDCYDWYRRQSSTGHNQTIVGCHLSLHGRNP